MINKSQEQLDAIKQGNAAADGLYTSNKDGTDQPSEEADINFELYLQKNSKQSNPKVNKPNPFVYNHFRVNKHALWYGDASVELYNSDGIQRSHGSHSAFSNPQFI